MSYRLLTHLRLSGSISKRDLDALIDSINDEDLDYELTEGGCAEDCDDSPGEFALYQGGTSLEYDVAKAIKDAGLSYIAYLYPDGPPLFSWLDAYSAASNTGVTKPRKGNSLLATAAEMGDCVRLQGIVDDLAVAKLVVTP